MDGVAGKEIHLFSLALLFVFLMNHVYFEQICAHITYVSTQKQSELRYDTRVLH